MISARRGSSSPAAIPGIVLPVGHSAQYGGFPCDGFSPGPYDASIEPRDLSRCGVELRPDRVVCHVRERRQLAVLEALEGINERLQIDVAGIRTPDASCVPSATVCSPKSR